MNVGVNPTGLNSLRRVELAAHTVMSQRRRHPRRRGWRGAAARRAESGQCGDRSDGAVGGRRRTISTATAARILGPDSRRRRCKCAPAGVGGSSQHRGEKARSRWRVDMGVRRFGQEKSPWDRQGLFMVWRREGDALHRAKIPCFSRRTQTGHVSCVVSFDLRPDGTTDGASRTARLSESFIASLEMLGRSLFSTQAESLASAINEQIMNH